MMCHGMIKVPYVAPTCYWSGMNNKQSLVTAPSSSLEALKSMS